MEEERWETLEEKRKGIGRKSKKIDQEFKPGKEGKGRKGSIGRILEVRTLTERREGRGKGLREKSIWDYSQ